MRRLAASGFVWLALLVVLAAARVASAQNSASVWISRLANEATRDQARDRLRDLGNKAVDALTKALTDKRAIIRSESAFVLGRIGDKSAVPALVLALKDPDATVRKKCAYALGEIADERAVDRLIEVVADPDADVRANACFALGQLGSPKSARVLVKALIDENEAVRNYAASALGFSGEKKVLPALVWSAKNDKSLYVRALAITSMGGLRDLRVCGFLITLLTSDEYLVRARAIESLLMLTRQRLSFDSRASKRRRRRALAKWVAWHKRNADRLGSIAGENPQKVYDWWFGPPKPKETEDPKVVKPKETDDPKPPDDGAKTKETDDATKNGDTPVPDPDKPAVVPLKVKTDPPRVSPLGFVGKRPGGPLVDMRHRRKVDAGKVEHSEEALGFFDAGVEHLEMGRVQKAVEAFEAVTKMVPKSVNAHFNLGICRLKQKRAEKAGAAFRKCLEIDPTDPAAYNHLGAIHETVGRTSDAETFYRLALHMNKTMREARFNLAEIFLHNGKFKSALTEYEILAGEKDGRPEIDASLLKLRQGMCKLRTGDADAAEQLLEEACKTTNQPFVLCEAARRFYDMKLFERAEAMLNRAYKISGGEAESAYLLAMFLLRVPDERLRDPERAAVYAEMASSAGPKDARYTSAMAEVAHQRGDKRQAIKLAERALKLSPDSAELKRCLEEYRKEVEKDDKLLEIGGGE